MILMKLKVIYEPKGRAKEYSDYALNIYNGCDFGCKYCFAPGVLKRDKENFHANILERDKFLEKLEIDCKNLAGLKNKVLLCFTCDPYNTLDNTLMTTRKVLELFKTYNINFHVLTKGGKRAERDFDLYKPGDAFASTLTFVDNVKSKEWEPNASLGIERIETLKKAKSLGIETWVSLEPVIDPNETLKIIEHTNEFVDFYKVGTLNYHDLAKTIDWKNFVIEAVSLLDSYSKNYYIKDDLKKFF